MITFLVIRAVATAILLALLIAVLHRYEGAVE
jgi:hypothetical protein